MVLTLTVVDGGPGRLQWLRLVDRSPSRMLLGRLSENGYTFEPDGTWVRGGIETTGRHAIGV